MEIEFAFSKTYYLFYYSSVHSIYIALQDNVMYNSKLQLPLAKIYYYNYHGELIATMCTLPYYINMLFHV